MAEKQAQLNGAYYGPSIPPPRQSYHRPGRGSDCCGCCLLKCLLQIVITAVVIIGLAVLIFWLIFRPNKVKFHVTEATLTEFKYTSANNTLQYNLALNISVRNPNKRIGIYYDKIEARAYYEDQRFGFQELTPFYQGHKNTSVLSTAFANQNTVVMLSGDDLTNYKEDNTAGVYNINVNLHLRIRLKFGKVKVGKFKPKVKCDLKVPLNDAASFKTTKCDIDY